MQKTAASYQIRSGLLNDAGTWTDTSWYDVPNAWSAIEIHYQAFANSGSLTLWLDDVQKQSLTFIDNDTRTVTDVRLGAQGVETGTRGTVYFDDFESRRFSYIGTLPDPGVDDPQATNAAGWKANTYSYSATIPHAVTSVAIEGGGTNTYQYDANGNMTCRIENGVVYTHAYNAENRASSIAKRNTDCTGTIIESWSFAYDGDGTRVLTAHFTGTSGTPDSTTRYYFGGSLESTDGTVTKYYSFAGQTIAMKEGGTFKYFVSDHLGSTSLVLSASGTILEQQRYLPFGAPRSIPSFNNITSTDFTYTGQRLLDAGMGGIMDYKARFYSPYLNQFTQPDTIVSNPYNPQSWNRYAYVLNNPIRYNDPTGHEVCSDDGYCGKLSDTSYQKYIYSNAIEDVYKWNLEGNWTLKELKTIYQTGRDIEEYVDGLTDGMGQEWMNEYLGGISISHGGDGRASSSWPWKQIYLGEDWLSGYGGGDYWTPKQLFAHELGHTWDMNSGNYLGIGGGVGDDLMWAVWGDPRASLRFWRYEGGDPAIPSNAYWNVDVNGGYGNGSINDYAAEAFSWSIYNPNNLPFGADGVVSMVVDQTIKFQASNLP